LVSEALVAVTTHEPTAVGVMVEPDTVQLPETFVNEYAPVPDPPDAVKAKFVPKIAEEDDVIETVD
jgi:hypothetical protein